jgi:flavin reductase (DIM6/NTAB) family NADH-FMN oxidoreductase RutF
MLVALYFIIYLRFNGFCFSLSMLLYSQQEDWDIRMGIEPQAFREVMAHWASGVTVVTSLEQGRPVGITVSSFASLSLQPPQILVCINRKLHTHDIVMQSGCFAVNILSIEQVAWGMRFAGMQPEVKDRFHDIQWASAETGSPLLPAVLGWLDCLVRHTLDGGDHTIFVGEVVASGVRDNGDPLVYYNRNWRRLANEPLSI